MRIAFLGKGGSGKTTTAAAFTLWAKKHHPHILAIDADVNVHLGKALLQPNPPKALNDTWDEITSYVVGTRDMRGTKMINTTPPNLESCFIDPSDYKDRFLQTFGSYQDGITLLNVGTYKADDVGENCYHAMLGNLAVVMHHTLDRETDLIVADTTAGIDNASTSLFFAYDLNIMLVEPTLRSVEVFKEFEKLAAPFGVNVKAVVNKMEDDEDKEFAITNLGKEKIISFLPYSKNVLALERGQQEAINDYVVEADQSFHDIYDHLVRTQKNWDKYYQNLLYAHERLHKEWFDQSMGQDASLQVQKEFSYHKAFENVYSTNKKVA